MATKKVNIKSEALESIEKIEEKETVIEKKVMNKRRVMGLKELGVYVKVINNCYNTWIYIDKRTQNTVELESYGDECYLTIGELRDMKNSQKAHLEKMWIYLVDVEDEEITIDDVLMYLSLDKLYENEFTKPENIIDLLINKDIKTFKNIVNSMNSLIFEKLLETSISLYKTGQFDSGQKIKFLEEKTKNEFLFDNLD